MYKFIKYKTKSGGKEFISDWCFEAQSLKDVIEFFNTYTKPVMNDGFGNMAKSCSNSIRKYGDNIEKYGYNIKQYFDMNHPRTDYEQAMCILMEIGGRSFIDCANKLQYDVLDGRIKSFLNNKDGKYRYFNPSDGLKTIALDDRYSEVCEEIYKDTIAFPTGSKPTIDDVKFTMWEGGKHWYAKVRNMDVVVDGEQKWNTKDEAIKAAKQFINENW